MSIESRIPTLVQTAIVFGDWDTVRTWVDREQADARERALLEHKQLRGQVMDLCKQKHEWSDTQYQTALRFVQHSIASASLEELGFADQQHLCGRIRVASATKEHGEDAELVQLQGWCSSANKATKPLLAKKLRTAIAQGSNPMALDSDDIDGMTKQQLCTHLGLAKYGGKLRASWGLTFDSTERYYRVPRTYTTDDFQSAAEFTEAATQARTDGSADMPHIKRAPLALLDQAWRSQYEDKGFLDV